MHENKNEENNDNNNINTTNIIIFIIWKVSIYFFFKRYNNLEIGVNIF